MKTLSFQYYDIHWAPLTTLGCASTFVRSIYIKQIGTLAFIRRTITINLQQHRHIPEYCLLSE